MAITTNNEIISKVDEVVSQEQDRPRILVVDDDHMSAKVVSRMIETHEFKVDIANGGVPALNYLSQYRYEVVITDLEMPDLSGYALACWMKEKSRNTRVIIMTGRGHSEVVKYMNSTIVDCWLFKPFGINDLETGLNNIMQPDLEESLCSY